MLLALLKSVKNWVFNPNANSWADKEYEFYFGEEIDESNEE
jgi:hypothetical protein